MGGTISELKGIPDQVVERNEGDDMILLENRPRD